MRRDGDRGRDLHGSDLRGRARPDGRRAWWPGGTWAGVSGIPPGYWVYIAPTWYIWERLAPTLEQAAA